MTTNEPVHPEPVAANTLRRAADDTVADVPENAAAVRDPEANEHFTVGGAAGSPITVMSLVTALVLPSLEATKPQVTTVPLVAVAAQNLHGDRSGLRYPGETDVEVLRSRDNRWVGQAGGAHIDHDVIDGHVVRGTPELIRVRTAFQLRRELHSRIGIPNEDASARCDVESRGSTRWRNGPKQCCHK